MLHVNIVWSNGREEKTAWDANLPLSDMKGVDKKNGATVVAVEILGYSPRGELLCN